MQINQLTNQINSKIIEECASWHNIEGCSKTIATAFFIASQVKNKFR